METPNMVMTVFLVCVFFLCLLGFWPWLSQLFTTREPLPESNVQDKDNSGSLSVSSSYVIFTADGPKELEKLLNERDLTKERVVLVGSCVAVTWFCRVRNEQVILWTQAAILYKMEIE